MKSTSFSYTLGDPEGVGFPDAWKEFLFNVDLVRSVTVEVGKDDGLKARILAAGQQWAGGGWTTGRAATALYTVSGVSLVSANFNDYLNAYLFSLCLYWGMEVQQLSLGDRAAEAAFALVQVYGGQAMLTDPEEPPEAAGTPREKDVPSEPMTFAWDEVEEDLPKELQSLWERAEKGKKIDIKALLSELPKWAQLPTKPKANNYRGDQHKQLDKVLRVSQQQLLQLLRVQTCLYAMCSVVLAPGFLGSLPGSRTDEGGAEAPDPAEVQQLQLQLWQLTADYYFALEAERKEFSLPGCTQSVEGLFGKDELNSVKFKSTVNKTFIPSMSGPQTGGM